MSDPDREAYYATLGLPPDATFDQVKARFREINDAYLKILELSRGGAKGPQSARPAPAEGGAAPPKPQQEASPTQGSSPAQETRTEPIAKIKARFAKGEIKKAQFEKLARERYEYLTRKPFSELTESDFEERLHGFDGLKFL